MVNREIHPKTLEEFEFSSNTSKRPLGAGREAKPMRLADTRRNGESPEEAKARWKSTSKSNICELLKYRPATATEIGVEPRWLNGLKKNGLGYESKKSAANFQALANHFGWDSYLDLWREDLLEWMGLPEPTDRELEEWKKSKNWKLAGKFLRMLDSGKFNYLRKLVEELSSLEATKSALARYDTNYIEQMLQEPKKVKKGKLKDKVESLKKKRKR